MSKIELDILLANRDASGVVGATPETLKISRCTGKLFGVNAPAFLKMGRSVRYRTSTLQEWLNQFEEQASTSQTGGEA